MNPKEYRRQVESQLGVGVAAAMVASVSEATAAPDWAEMIHELQDHTVSPAMRQTAIRRLQAGTFFSNDLVDHHAAYVEALRAAAVDKDVGLRRAALDILANLKDDFARQRLEEGLRDPGKALVAPAVALGLLARDDHGSSARIARDILIHSSDVPAREQAARVLAADPDSKALLEKVVKDKAEYREVRRAGAVALRNLDPQAFAEGAREILADPDDFSDIKATVQGALERDGLLPPRQRQP